MLSLAPPYHLIGGYSLLPDHADPRQWYVLPTAPSLARTPDGAPAFSLVQYLGGGAGGAKVAGGLLTLTTELTVPDEALALLRAGLGKTLNRPPTELHLSTVFFDSGTVELVALGTASASGEPAVPAPFNIQILGSGRASLGGRNTATFQLVLDELAAELVEKALDAPDLPVIATYRLTFAGLRPSFSVKVQADWTRVYRHLEQKLKANLYYVTADVQTQISRALEDSGVQIDVTVLGTGEGEAAAAERARQQLTDWVLERLFTPVANPAAATANAVGDAVSGLVSGLVRTVIPGVSYSLKVMDDQQLRTLSARMNEAVAERREVLPQGTLGGLLRGLRLDEQGKVRPDWPVLRRQLVTQVNLDGFPRLEVQVSSEDRFARDGLAEVRAELARMDGGGTPTEPRKIFALRSAAEKETYLVNLLGQDAGQFSRLYQTRLEVQFDPTGPFGPHPPVQGDWQPGRAAELVVEPRTVYGVQEVQVSAAPSFPFAQFPTVTTELRFDGEPGTAPQLGRVELSAAQPSGSWRFRYFAAEGRPLVPPPYQVTLTYHRADAAGGPITSAPQLWTDDDVSVPDPLPFKRPLNLFVSLPWADVFTAFVQLRYRDKPGGIQFDEQIPLSAATPYLRRDYPIAEGGPQTLGYRLTLLTTSGSLLEGSWRETLDDRLVIDRRLVERRAVRVQCVGGPLDTARLREVRVQLQRRDPQGQVREETELTFTRGQPLTPAAWEVLLGDPPVKTIFFSAVFVEESGFVTRTPWTASDADLLVVQLKTRSVSG
ncbi:hypothetical protein K7W42_03375 [Deinococcus sp. HMF7604]|uniref:hypothetical protein n=1 Tax=Deinococcus betulae TaxID=2873312 RepID=UPI001CCA1C95|nr:hypothetical protein [Deinococcus betulae]MBZ9749900.1 hypothetical protein [Deinococcus betulae]